MKLLLCAGLMVTLLRPCLTQLKATKTDNQLICPDGHLMSLGKECFKSGDIGKGSEAHPCGEGEVWREAFDDTGIGGCYQEMESLNTNNRRLNRFHVPLNSFLPSPRFPSASRWRPIIPHQNGDHHQFCGRCIRYGRVQLCCEGDGIGPR